jgi:drug/metabolite transporter (DMT)-like permease
VRTAILAVALVFTAAMAFGTFYVLLKSGPDVFTLLGLLLVGLFAFGIFGALAQPPDRRG